MLAAASVANASVCVSTRALCRHVVFGEVVDGLDVVQKIEQNPTDRRDGPLKPVAIADAGEL